MYLIPYVASFDIDLSGLLDMADTIFSGLAGAFVPIWGIVLGLGVLGVVGAFILKAVKFKS